MGLVRLYFTCSSGKNSFKKMNFEVAKATIDYILNNKTIFNEDGAIFDLIGGEPLLEIELMDRIVDYIKQQMYLLKHPWFNNYRINISTNGILYSEEKVQKFISKNHKHLSIGISVDGNKEKHDSQRIDKSGQGSYDRVVANVPLWIRQFPSNSTKATFSSDDLPYLKDSIISLWNLGIKVVAANLVYENVWKKGDPELFEQQLIELADYIIENELWNAYSVRFFDPIIGFPVRDCDREINVCGTSNMITADCEGNFYTCIRFLDFSLNNHKGLKIGDIYNGINEDFIRPFHFINFNNISSNECKNCEVASGCNYCAGLNYDEAEIPTLYNRSIHICDMHKANVRASEYFWNKYTEIAGELSPRHLLRQERKKEITKDKFLLFIKSDKIKPHCSYTINDSKNEKMTQEIYEKGIAFAKNNNYTPVMMDTSDTQNVNKQQYMNVSGIENIIESVSPRDMPIYEDTNALQDCTVNGFSCILLINKSNLLEMSDMIKRLSLKYSRINVKIQDLEKWTQNEIMCYEKELDKTVKTIVEQYKLCNKIQVNILTDKLYLKKMNNCTMGEDSFALAPNGKIYICPGFYFDDPENDIGDIDNGIKLQNEKLLNFESAFLCQKCDAYHCNRCKYLNKKLTNAINIPSKIQCVISHIEREKSRLLQLSLIDSNTEKFNKCINKLNYTDPLEIIKA